MSQMSIGTILEQLLDDIMRIEGQTWEDKRDNLLYEMSEEGKNKLVEFLSWFDGFSF